MPLDTNRQPATRTHSEFIEQAVVAAIKNSQLGELTELVSCRLNYPGRAFTVRVIVEHSNPIAMLELRTRLHDLGVILANTEIHVQFFTLLDLDALPAAKEPDASQRLRGFDG
jgi:hypothetical protein